MILSLYQKERGVYMEALTNGVINVHVDPKDKEEATTILKDLGLNMTTLINMMLKQVIKKRAIPFDVSLSKETDDLYNYFTKEELNETAKELEYIKSNIEEYKKNNKWEDLKTELLNEKI